MHGVPSVPARLGNSSYLRRIDGSQGVRVKDALSPYLTPATRKKPACLSLLCLPVFMELVVTMWKYLIAWLVMLLVSVANGALRDFTYGKHMHELAAHQLSSISSVVLLGLVILSFVRIYPPSSGREAVLIGLLWMALTVAFEFIFFHYVAGHAWAELLANYNVLQGRVWVVVLVWLAIAPYIFYRLRLNGPRYK